MGPATANMLDACSKAALLPDDPSKDPAPMLAVRENVAERDRRRRHCRRKSQPRHVQSRSAVGPHSRLWVRPNHQGRSTTLFVLHHSKIGHAMQDSLDLRNVRLTTSWRAYMNELKEGGPNATTKAMVIAEHPPTTAFKVQAQLLSGFFTCKQWMAQSLSRHRPPHCVFYTSNRLVVRCLVGINKTGGRAYTRNVRDHAWRKYCMGVVTIINTDRLATHHQKYVSRHGPNMTWNFNGGHVLGHD